MKLACVTQKINYLIIPSKRISSKCSYDIKTIGQFHEKKSAERDCLNGTDYEKFLLSN